MSNAVTFMFLKKETNIYSNLPTAQLHILCQMKSLHFCDFS